MAYKKANFKRYDELTLQASEPLKRDIQKLMYKINHDTVYAENETGTSFVSNIMASINIGAKAKFMDMRFWKKPKDKVAETKNPDCMIELGSNKIFCIIESGMKTERG